MSKWSWRRHRGRNVGKRLSSIQKMGIALLAFLLATFCMEVAIRIFITGPSISVSDPVMGRMWAPHAEFHQALEGSSAFVTNDLGLNDVDVARAGTHGIVVLGDSFVEGAQLARAENAVSLYRSAHPSPSILNGGRRGLGLLYYRTLLDYVRPHYRPDLIVVVATNYSIASLRRSDFTVIRDAGGAIRQIDLPALWSGEGPLFQFSYSVAQKSGLIQYLLFKFEDRIKGIFGIAIGVMKGDELSPDTQGLVPLESGEMRDVVAYALMELQKVAPVRLIYIPEMDYRSAGIAKLSPLSQQAAVLFMQAAGRDHIPFIDLAPAISETFHRTGQEAFGFSNGVPGGGHLNALGHRLLERAIESAVTANAAPGKV